jgi:hypothetical protein
MELALFRELKGSTFLGHDQSLRKSHIAIYQPVYVKPWPPSLYQKICLTVFGTILSGDSYGREA